MDDILTLQDFTHLVPKKDLCEKLPRIPFSKSLFVWDDEGKLMDRITAQIEYSNKEYETLIPAPTAGELLEAFRKLPSVTGCELYCDPGCELYCGPICDWVITWANKKLETSIQAGVGGFYELTLAEVLCEAYLSALKKEK